MMTEYVQCVRPALGTNPFNSRFYQKPAENIELIAKRFEL